MIKIDVIPDQETTDNSTRIKACAIVATSSGQNIPCSKCINDGYNYYYSQYDDEEDLDSVSWSIQGVRNLNLRKASDFLNVNQLK